MKRRRGDRRDGALVREADALHKFMPYLMPKRTECEAFNAGKKEASRDTQNCRKRTNPRGRHQSGKHQRRVLDP